MGMGSDIADLLGFGKKKEEETTDELVDKALESTEETEEKEEEVIEEVSEKEESIEEESEGSEEVVGTEEESEEGEEEEEIEETNPLKISENQNKLLLTRIEELEGKVTPELEEESEEETPEVVSFLADDDDIDAVLNDKTKLNALLVSVYNKAIVDSGMNAQGVAPNVVTEQIEKYMTLKGGIDEFFSANEDLLPVRKTVGAITNEIVAEHEDWTLKKVLVEAEKRTRESLGIKKKVKVKSKRNPALIKKGSNRKAGSDTRTSMQKDIDDLIG